MAPWAAVKVKVDKGELTAATTRDAVTELGLKAGSTVVVLMKSAEASPVAA
ncbi:TOBE domain-containing protein [Streptomyces sp. NPDC000609]|uniref:TOBE domain-containing protein n=1 Tax=Streptomyces sp. NPDC000609 TaxID=3160957 RepID=UPI0033928A67